MRLSPLVDLRDLSRLTATVERLLTELNQACVRLDCLESHAHAAGLAKRHPLRKRARKLNRKLNRLFSETCELHTVMPTQGPHRSR